MFICYIIDTCGTYCISYCKLEYDLWFIESLPSPQEVSWQISCALLCYFNFQVRWMMYWIVCALYTVTETITDLTVSWFPLYYELKIAFVICLLSPYTRGTNLIYRKFLHPLLSSKEREIDEYIVQAKETGYETMVNFGRQGLNLAATAAVTAAVKVSFCLH
uniref:Receptor expression-enhancing protein n=2 Tax=Cyanistes caeruleus TaxID=156563 RepID=A0A8C0U187_CYACU